jgi:cytochrome b6-f complex iron-sulfur subunit
LDRRGFLAAVTRALLWATAGATAVGLGRYLSYEPPDTKPHRFTLEPPEAYPTGARVVVPQAGVAVYRDDAGFFARLLTCGHLGCRVHLADDGGFACPCHGSQFTRDGARRAGPAPRDLDGAELSLDDQGRLVLDTSIRVDPVWRLPMGAALGRRPGAMGSEG